MEEIPAHSLPKYTSSSNEEVLFHYTSATGLYGILSNQTIWGTGYYCTNDESELSAGKGVLDPIFRQETHKLIEAKDPRIEKFYRRGVDPMHYADGFERRISAMALSSLCAYITCFCSSTDEEDFLHGRLSQWRGYGLDGGYAIQFSRPKLAAAIDEANKVASLRFELQDVHYDTVNPLKTDLLNHSAKFIEIYNEHLDELAEPISFQNKKMKNPLVGLLGGPLESLLEYLVHTKNKHFVEERECRLSLIQLISDAGGNLPVSYFNRSGLLVPYIATPKTVFNILDCIDWILVGPGPRLAARMKSINQLVRQTGREILVRPSHIPFTRF